MAKSTKVKQHKQFYSAQIGNIDDFLNNFIDDHMLWQMRTMLRNRMVMINVWQETGGKIYAFINDKIS